MRLYVLDRKPIFQTGHWSAAPRRPRQRTARHISGTAGCGFSAAPACRMFLLEAVPRDRSFDHLVGDGEQPGRQREAERLGSLEVDDQLEFDRLHDRQIGGLLALEDPPGVDSPLAVGVHDAVAIAQYPPS